ncbi:MAG: tetratricopeptide repeat protein [Rhodospirillales bacterium]
MKSFDSFVDFLKKISISIVALAGVWLGGYTLYDGVSGNLIIMEQVRVPPSFDYLGYNSQVTTQRLLDEMAQLNSFATLGTTRKKYGDRALFNNIAQSETSLAGIDLKTIRAAVQKALGRQTKRISGEIALVDAEGSDSFSYTVRIRSNPPRKLLLDIEAKGTPKEVIQQTALALLGQLDPAVAISAYRAMGDFDNALRMADLALTNDDPSDDMITTQQRSFVYVSMGRFAEAEADALKADNWGRHTALSNVYRASGKLDKALAEANAAIKLKPDKPQPYIHKARALMAMKKFDDTILILEKTAKSFPAYWNAHNWLGNAYYAKGDFLKAKDEFNKALSLSPKSPALWFKLANVYRAEKNDREALARYRHAHELNPKNVKFLMALIKAESKTGNAEHAETLKKSLRKLLGNPTINEKLKKRAETLLSE